jgi:preprotein translocase subunit YajC
MNQPRHLVLRPEFQGTPQGKEKQPFVPRNQAGDESEATQQEAAGGKAGPPQEPCVGGSTMPMILGMVLIFYFLLIRPQQKQEKQRKAMLAAVKEGDKVVTSGGIHGTISSLTEEKAVLRVDQKVKLTVDRHNIARRLDGDETKDKTR